MKIILSAVVAAGLLASPAVFAQSSSTMTPGAANTPIHSESEHDKGASVRVDNNNGVTGRSSSDSMSPPVRAGQETTDKAAPGSADSPIHGDHDKGKAVNADK